MSRGLKRKEQSQTKWDSFENVYETVVFTNACKIMSVCIEKKVYLINLFIYLFCLFVFLGPHLWHMEVPRLGVESKR